MSDLNTHTHFVQHVFIIGAKSIGQYGGYETFVDRLLGEHEHETRIKYHIACKANGDGCMDESKLSNISDVVYDKNGKVQEFTYKGAHVFKLPCPNIGPAVAIYYDCLAVKYSLKYCQKNEIQQPIFYILTCRIGLRIKGLVKAIHQLNGKYMLNPDGHEWKREKWPMIVRKYWKWSEKKMVSKADLVICDSVNIEKYIISEYNHPHTTFIAYGADIKRSNISDNDYVFLNWLDEHKLHIMEYYLVVGRFVPENNYKIMIREFLMTKTTRDFVLITNANEKYLKKLEEELHWKKDKRIKFVGTVYDKELLKKIRECAYGYFHGHEVGGTNPSLLEALGSTDLNLLLAVGFNQEVGQDAALYWNKENGSLSGLIAKAEELDDNVRMELGNKAKDRIRTAYSWEYIGKRYKSVFLKE